MTFQGITYTVDQNPGSRKVDGASDLCIYSITGGTFPTYAPLYDETVDGPEAGKTLITIGRGWYQRGTAVYAGTNLAGWQYASWSNVQQTWGQNTVSGTADYTDSKGNVLGAGTLLQFNFDGDGANPYEAILVPGDSSGGVFIQGANGQWKLAGINYAVSGPYSRIGQGSGFNAAIYDARGLYEWDGAKWVLHDPADPNPEPGYSQASSISARLGWIEGVLAV